MMAFTADGQLNPALLEARDKRLGAPLCPCRHCLQRTNRCLWPQRCSVALTFMDRHALGMGSRSCCLSSTRNSCRFLGMGYRVRAGVNTAELREKRQSSIKPPDSIAAGANHWENAVGGARKAWQTTMEQVDFLV